MGGNARNELRYLLTYLSRGCDRFGQNMCGHIRARVVARHARRRLASVTRRQSLVPAPCAPHNVSSKCCGIFPGTRSITPTKSRPECLQTRRLRSLASNLRCKNASCKNFRIHHTFRHHPLGYLKGQCTHENGTKPLQYIYSVSKLNAFNPGGSPTASTYCRLHRGHGAA